MNIRNEWLRRRKRMPRECRSKLNKLLEIGEKVVCDLEQMKDIDKQLDESWAKTMTPNYKK